MDTTSFKSVDSFSGLVQFGINGLTREACAYSMRMLCDVNEDGKALLEEYFGTQLQLAPQYNSFVGEKPSIGSIMLMDSLILSLAQFAFFRAGAVAILLTFDREVKGIFSEERLAQYESLIEQSPRNEMSIRRNHALKSTAPHVGSRNQHAFTGRIQ